MKTLTIQISEDTLNKLKWIHQGVDESKLVAYAIGAYVSRMEKMEGTVYPTDRLPEDVLDGLNLTS